MLYRKEIDGLRAVAVLAVMLFHADFHLFSGGFVGVDVFFVISGFLITHIMLANIQAGTFSLVGFYERRARRILPALFVMMLLRRRSHVRIVLGRPQFHYLMLSQAG
jgi:peptidoglycan/LPS O-acetylase OafA/YrhL